MPGGNDTADGLQVEGFRYIIFIGSSIVQYFRSSKGEIDHRRVIFLDLYAHQPEDRFGFYIVSTYNYILKKNEKWCDLPAIVVGITPTTDRSSTRTIR